MSRGAGPWRPRPFLCRSLRGRYFSGFVAQPFVRRGTLDVISSGGGGINEDLLTTRRLSCNCPHFLYRGCSLAVLDGSKAPYLIIPPATLHEVAAVLASPLNR